MTLGDCGRLVELHHAGDGWTVKVCINETNLDTKMAQGYSQVDCTIIDRKGLIGVRCL